MATDPAIAGFNSYFDAAAGPDTDAMPAAGLQVLASLSATLGRLAAAEEARQAKAQRMTQAIRQLTVGPFSIPITAGAGTLDQAPSAGPNTGYAWSDRRLTASGFTAGTVAVYLNSAQGEPLPSFPSAGTATFGRGDILLQPQDNLVFVCAGITLAAGLGSVQIQGTADNIELWALPDYLL